MSASLRTAQQHSSRTHTHNHITYLLTPFPLSPSIIPSHRTGSELQISEMLDLFDQQGDKASPRQSPRATPMDGGVNNPSLAPLDESSTSATEGMDEVVEKATAQPVDAS